VGFIHSATGIEFVSGERTIADGTVLGASRALCYTTLRDTHGRRCVQGHTG